MTTKLQDLVLITKNSSGKGDKFFFSAKQSTYVVKESISIALVDQKTNKTPPDVIYKRKGNSLIVELQNGDSVELENFYSENAALFSNDVFSGMPVDLSSSVLEASATSSYSVSTASTTEGFSDYMLPFFGALGFAGVVASNRGGSTPPPPEAIPSFEIYQTEEGRTLPFSMEVGDRLEIVRDDQGNITGYILNDEPASEEFIAALMGINWMIDEPNDVFIDIIEVRQDGTYFLTSDGNELVFNFESGSRWFENDAYEREFYTDNFDPIVTGPLFVEALDHAYVDFGAGLNAVNPYSALESISVIADKDSELWLSNDGAAYYMNDLLSLHVVGGLGNSSTDYTAQLDISASRDWIDLEAVGAHFMDKLETISIIGVHNASASMSLSHSGGEYFMPALQSIYLEANGINNSADFSLSASVNTIAVYDPVEDDNNYVDPLANHHFMGSLQTIEIISNQADASLSVSTSGGNYFMESLRTIEVYAGETAAVSLSVSANDYTDGSLRSDFFMQALETINITGATDDASLSISVSGGIDFMASLTSIYIESADRTQVSISASVNYTGATGHDFMALLEDITLISNGNTDNTGDAASLSMTNEGGDRFMASLETISVEGRIGAEAIVNISNISSTLEQSGSVNDGNNFMNNLTTISAIASNEANHAVVTIHNEAGSEFMTSLQTIDVVAQNALVRLDGMMGTSSNDSINIDLTGVEGSENSLAFVLTNNVGFENSTAKLVIEIGSSNLQYNAVYEVASEDENYLTLPNPDSPDPDNPWLSYIYGLFTQGVEYDAGNIIQNEYLNENYYSGFGTVQSGDYEGFAGIYDYGNTFDWGYNNQNQPINSEGWVDLGPNGVIDIFKFTDLDIGTIVIGGFESDKDIFDFSSLSSVFSASSEVNDQTSRAIHVDTDLGDILVTQADVASDAILWLNTSGGVTSTFSDFESSIYVVGGAGLTWNQSNFDFVI